MDDIIHAVEFFGLAILSIIVISNPVSTSAVFIALTEGFSHEKKHQTAKKSVTYSLGILLFFAITGFLVFQLFGFSVGAFRIAGGILLFSTAVGMLNPATSTAAAKETSSDIALIPLSIPFTSGPGTIVVTVVLMTEAQKILSVSGVIPGMVAIAGVLAAIVLVIAISYLMMAESDWIYARVKEGGRKVVTRLMGLLVMAISIQFIINGIKDILPEFVSVLP